MSEAQRNECPNDRRVMPLTELQAAAWIKLCNPNDQFTPIGDGSK